MRRSRIPLGCILALLSVSQVACAAQVPTAATVPPDGARELMVTPGAQSGQKGAAQRAKGATAGPAAGQGDEADAEEESSATEDTGAGAGAGATEGAEDTEAADEAEAPPAPPPVAPPSGVPGVGASPVIACSKLRAVLLQAPSLKTRLAIIDVMRTLRCGAILRKVPPVIGARPFPFQFGRLPRGRGFGPRDHRRGS